MECWNIGKATGLLLMGFFCCLMPEGAAQTADAFIQEQVDKVSYDSVFLRMQTLENMGVKTAGSDALDQTRDWIIDLYQHWGYTDIELDEFTYSQQPVQNIIITKTGSLYPETYLIVDGHYDTWGGPGVNDNGSGTAIVLETARMMKDMETAYSIKFIHFTMEEMGLIGSNYYVDNTVIPENMDIRLVFNIDEVGGVAGEVNNTVTCERDEWPPNGNNEASAAFTDTLATLTELYTDLNTSINYAYGSDYVPFMNNGYVVTGYYEYNESPFPHSINDSLSNLDPDYVYELAKASLASTMYFAGAYETISETGPLPEHHSHFMVEPNPFSGSFRIANENEFTVQFELLDLHGRVMKHLEVLPGSATSVKADLTEGIYFYRIIREGRVIQTGKMISK